MMTEQKTLRERTDDYANEWAGSVNPIGVARESALLGPPIEFAIEQLERIATIGNTDWSDRIFAAKHIAAQALEEIMKARG